LVPLSARPPPDGNIKIAASMKLKINKPDLTQRDTMKKPEYNKISRQQVETRPNRPVSEGDIVPQSYN
jgi:hypothetical protein